MTTSTKPPDNKVIRASAGTGKTFQLSNRFLALIAGDAAPDELLASTFTRKAAGEILDRVILRVAEAAGAAGKAAELARHLGRPASQADCRRWLCRLLQGLHRLRIGTLDSFFIQVAKSLSLELGLPPGWEIIDERFDAELRFEAVRRVLATHSTADVVRLMNLLGKGETAQSVSDQLRQLVGSLFAVFREAQASAWKRLPMTTQCPQADVTRWIDELDAAEAPASKNFPTQKQRAVDFARDGFWEELLKLTLVSKVLDGEAKYDHKPIPAEIAEPLLQLANHAICMVRNRIAQQNEATCDLLGRFAVEYGRLQRERRALRFEDVTRLLADDADLPARLDDVARRMDADVRHILLDEFQDTSPPQWRVLRAFAQGALKASGGSFFCVGDVKQAIYGWRGGVAAIFDTLEDDLGPLAAGALSQSRRSCQPVIDTVNRAMANLATRPALKDDKAAAAAWDARFAAHTTVRSELPGYCLLSEAPPPAEGEKPRWAAFRYAAAKVAELHRAHPQRTIGVLVRKNESVAGLIFLLKQEHRIEASEEGGMPLPNSAAVEVVLSALALADHPGSTTLRFHLAHSPLAATIGIVDWRDTLAAIKTAAAIRRQVQADGYGPTTLGWMRALAAACGPRDLRRLGQLVELAYRYDADATNRPGDFVDLVRQLRVEDPSAAAVRVMTVHQAKGLEFDAVFLPELGYEFVGNKSLPFVVGRASPCEPVNAFCRGLNEKLRARILPPEMARLFDEHRQRTVEEALCLLYVAMTRAVHHLHMIVPAPRQREPKSTPKKLLVEGLAPFGPASGTTLYAHGDPDWAAKLPSRPLPPAPVERELRLAAPPPLARRGLPLATPSGREGSPRLRPSQWLKKENRAAATRGSLLHAWFEQVGWLDEAVPTDEELLAIAARAEFRGVDAPECLRQFRRALAQPAIRLALVRSAYARGEGVEVELIRERPFAVRQEGELIVGQADRLVVVSCGGQPRSADVVDFKSDAVDGLAAIDARVDFYRPQLEEYRKAVMRMYGLPRAQVTARLVFVQPGAVCDV